MKIQIDFDNKIIKVEGKVNFKELVDKVKMLLPDEWREFELETNTIIYYNYPTIYSPIYPYPHWIPYITYCGSGTTLTGATGTTTTTNISSIIGSTVTNTGSYLVEV